MINVREGDVIMKFNGLYQREDCVSSALEDILAAKEALGEVLPDEAAELEYFASTLENELFSIRADMNYNADCDVLRFAEGE